MEIEDSISHLASLSSSGLGCDSRRFHIRNYYMAGIGLGLDLSGLCIAGVVASRVQWRFGIFALGFRWQSS